ncbi:MAG: recombination protein RecR [Acidobacteria bacterium]|nr:recombination protein RecR [Acidobacteriota bacterium]
MKTGDPIVDRLVDLIAKMPGIGRKTAQRLAFFILAQPEPYALDLSESIRQLKENLRTCPQCFNFCHQELCSVCSQTSRDTGLMCVIEDAMSLNQIERTGHYRGYYHVLQGALSPIHGIGPKELRIQELLARLKTMPVQEVILATNPTLEGEATAMYLAELLGESGVKLSRIGTGIPMGGSLDYVDEITMTKALDNRRTL